MKINNYGPSNVNPYQQQMKNIEKVKNAANKEADKVEISTTAKEMQQMKQISSARKEKIEQLKLQIQNGTYKVNPEQVAKSMIDFYTKK